MDVQSLQDMARAAKATWRETGSDADYAAYLQAFERYDAAKAAQALLRHPIGSSISTTIHGLTGAVDTSGTVEGFSRGTYYVRTEAHGVVCVEPSKILQSA